MTTTATEADKDAALEVAREMIANLREQVESLEAEAATARQEAEAERLARQEEGRAYAFELDERAEELRRELRNLEHENALLTPDTDPAERALRSALATLTDAADALRHA